MLTDDSIQSMGGKARAESLTDEQKSEIAKKAATARWAQRPLQATHRGNFKEEFGIDVECYVLNDQQKTAVISQSGMGRALGLSSGGSKFPRFLASKAMSLTVGPELDAKLSQPIKFQWGKGGPETAPAIVHGFDVSILIDLCRVIIQVESVTGLGKRNARVVAQSHVILNASAKAGIKGLVYALAGYSPSAEEVIAAFKLYVLEEAKKYEREFPNELYAEWYRLYEIPIRERGKPWNFKHLTVNHIYEPLAQSDGNLLKLLREAKASGGNRKQKLFQFLNELGARALRIHLGRVLEMAESSKDRAAYEKRIIERFGGQQELELAPIPKPSK